MDRSNTRRAGGTGLGLAIAKELIDRMGGTIGCDSEPGSGSLFWAELPLSVRYERAPVSAMVLASPSQAAADAAELTLDVLLAEDNPVNQEVARESLSQLGCRVDMVADGRSALAAWQAGKYDLVLMDCRMLELDGFGATRAIRQAEREGGGRARTPIVALTANASSSDRADCLAADMDDHLAKPFTLAQLPGALVRWSGRGTSAPTVAPPRPAVAPLPAGDLPESFDPKALEPIRALERRGRTGVLPRVIDMFLAHTPDVLAKLSRGAAQGDRSAVAMAAHSLKSSSANLGPARIAHLCRALEQEAKQGAVADAEARVAALTQEYADVSPGLFSQIPPELAASA
ncbi:MAG: response regulator [Alphaproteobacteria bacterium]|nr:response regulator [Alphaproteobacteria bacterium]